MRFEGCFVALVTPFDKQGRLDELAYRRLIRRQLKAGVTALVCNGSTGEAAALTHQESRRCLQLCLEESRGEIPVVAGIGTNATWKALESAREAERMGADALLVLAPYYNKPTQEGLYQHFRCIAEGTRLPIMIYNIPGRTAINIQPQTIIRLAQDCPNIVSLKEAGGSLDQASEIISQAPKGFSLLSGDDNLTLPMMAIGARGVVSVAANLVPEKMVALGRHCLNGEAKKAMAIHLKLFPLVKALFIETNPIPVKFALSLLGLCREHPRLPLTPLSAEARPSVKRALKNFGLL